MVEAEHFYMDGSRCGRVPVLSWSSLEEESPTKRFITPSLCVGPSACHGGHFLQVEHVIDLCKDWEIDISTHKLRVGGLGWGVRVGVAAATDRNV